MKFNFEATVEIEGNEVEVTVRGTITPGEPMVRYDRNGGGHPGADPEVDEMEVILNGEDVYSKLTRSQIESLEERAFDDIASSDDDDGPEYSREEEEERFAEPVCFSDLD